MPLFRVVLLQSSSSLTQQELRGEHLVVGLLLHELLKVAQCCLHERSDLLREFLNGGPGSSSADIMNCLIRRSASSAPKSCSSKGSSLIISS